MNNNNNIRIAGLAGFAVGCTVVTFLGSCMLFSSVGRKLFFQLDEISTQKTKRKTKKNKKDGENNSIGSIGSISSISNSNKSSSKLLILPDELRKEQLSRHTLYFGSDGMKSIQGSKVVVVGLGGVGSHTASMLVRGGIGHIRLIDFDQVTLSSLNRHACATLQDVGIPKVTCMKNFLQQIVGGSAGNNSKLHCKVETFVEMYTEQNGHDLLQFDNDNDKWDMVVDAIDDVPTKAALLAYCIQNKIRVISCMGAGGKSDSTRLHISDLRAASKDPLATKLRQSLKKKLSKKTTTTEKLSPSPSSDPSYLEDMDQLTIIYSSEKTVVKLADFTQEQKDAGVHNYGAMGDQMRIRIIPVLGTMPAIMGQTLASIALCQLGSKPILNPVGCERVGRTVRHRIFQHLKRREDLFTKRILSIYNNDNKNNTSNKKNTENGDMNNNDTISGADIGPKGRMVSIPRNSIIPTTKEEEAENTIIHVWIGPPQIDMDDMEYLLEIWKNRCAMTGDRLGNVLQLLRWDISKSSNCHNLVLMSRTNVEKLDQSSESYSLPTSIQLTKRTMIQNTLQQISMYTMDNNEVA